MKRKFLCLLLALTLVLGLAATVSAYPDIYDPIYEDDINDTLWGCPAHRARRDLQRLPCGLLR